MQNSTWILFDTETTGFSKPIFAVELAAQRPPARRELHQQHRRLGARTQHQNDVGVPHELQRACLVDEQLGRFGFLGRRRVRRYCLDGDVAALPPREMHRAEAASPKLLAQGHVVLVHHPLALEPALAPGGTLIRRCELHLETLKFSDCTVALTP